MAKKHAQMANIGKWVVAPFLLALFGYYVVGPRLGKPSKEASKPPVNRISTQPGAPPIAGGGTSTTGANLPAGPDLDITVHKTHHRATQVADLRPDPPVRHKRRHVEPKTEESPKPATKPSDPVGPPADDQGGSGGATTAG